MMNTASQKPSEILNLSLNSTNQRLEHLAVILDGNRRWARANGVSTREGYRKGGEAVHRLLSWCEENSIPLVTLWPLSKDNLKREPSEVEDLLITIAEVIEQLVDSGKWRLSFFGEKSVLPENLIKIISNAESSTRTISGTRVNIGVAYSGKLEIVHALQEILATHISKNPPNAPNRKISIDEITNNLYSAGTPDPDLVIRTSGEQRLSDFMLWQCAYSEFYFCDVCWPDFSREDFDLALQSFANRQRRAGY